VIILISFLIVFVYVEIPY
jgi:hypothetical protein